MFESLKKTLLCCYPLSFQRIMSKNGLPIMLDAATSYVNKHRSTLIKSCQSAAANTTKATSIEWIIVSDGSTDDTCTVVRDYAGKQQTTNDTTTLGNSVLCKSTVARGQQSRRACFVPVENYDSWWMLMVLPTLDLASSVSWQKSLPPFPLYLVLAPIFRLASSEVLSAHFSCTPFTFSSHYYVHPKYKIHNVGLSSLRNVHRNYCLKICI